MFLNIIRFDLKVEKRRVYCEVGKGIFNLGQFRASNLFFLNFSKIIFPMSSKLTFPPISCYA